MPRKFGWEHGQGDVGRDVKRELDFHVEERARELRATGLSADEAMTRARAEFGDRHTIQSEVAGLRAATVRTRQRRNWLEDLRLDLAVALRGLRRTPGFTLVALLTLTLGIGANSAVFSIVRSVLLRPLPYPSAAQLVQVWSDYRARNGRARPEWLTPPDFADWRDQNRTFNSMAAYQAWAPVLTGVGDPATLSGLAVSGDFFRVLGVPAALGRTLTLADDDAGAEPVAVISDALWRGRFGGDPAVIDRVLQLNGTSWRVVGVMPPSFRAPVPFKVDVVRPARRPATSGCNRGCVVLRVIGRLKPGATFAQAQADLGGVAAHIATAYPASNSGVGAWLIPLHEQVTGPVRAALLTLTGAVALVLLIACVNIANLLLLRGAERASELGVRTAIGATRSRLTRQLLAESTLLAVIGGLLGMGVGVLGARALSVVVPEGIRDIQSIDVDAVVLLYTAGIVVLAGLLFGLLPALKVAGGDLMSVLRSGFRETGRSGNRTRNVLASAQFALAVMLLVGAGLLIRSLLLMQRVDLGFRTGGVLVQNVGLPRARYSDTATIAVTRQILATLRSNPAIRAAEVTDDPPLSAGDQDESVRADGEPPTADHSDAVWYRATSPGFLQLMQMRLVSGRYFNAGDRAGASLVGIINAEAARKFWGNKNPVGRILALGSDSMAPRLTIVGVIASDRQDGPSQPVKAELFVPFEQQPDNGYSIVVEPAHGDPAAIGALRDALHAADPLLAIEAPVTMEGIVGDVTALPRLYATLLAVFASAALLLAIIGVYGVMAYVVRQRLREIGVRLALGASPLVIYRLVLWRGMSIAALGAVAGLIGAATLGRLLGAMLFGVTPLDPITFASVPLVLAVTAFVACWIPARRAMRVDPLTALRG